MATVRIVLEAGQSNAAPTGEIQSWESLYPYLAIRNPTADPEKAPVVFQGAYGDLFPVTGSFPGGWVADASGAETTGQMQLANCTGQAIQLIRKAIFYNPSAAHLTYDNYATEYPGKFRLRDATQYPSKIETTLFSQVGDAASVATLNSISSGTFTTNANHGFAVDDYVTFGTINPAGVDGGVVFGDRTYQVASVLSGTTFALKEWPSGVTVTGGTGASLNIIVAKVFPFEITRTRTGSQHTAVPVGLISRTAGFPYVLTVDPPLLPPPEPGEVFEHEHVLLQDAATAASPMRLNHQYGGFVDAGSVFDVSKNCAVNIGYEDRGTGAPATYRLSTRETLVRPGMAMRLALNPTYIYREGISYSTSAGSATLTAGADTTDLQVGQRIYWTDNFGGSGSSSGISSGYYYVKTKVSETEIEISATPGGSVVAATTGTTFTNRIANALPTNLDTLFLYVTRIVDDATELTYSLGSSLVVASSNVFDTQGVNHLLVEGEKVRVTGTGTAPTGLTYGSTYYVKQGANPDEFKLTKALRQRYAVAVASPNFTSLYEEDFYVGQPVYMSEDGDDVPGGFTPGATYYVASVIIPPLASGVATITLSDTVGGAPINVSSLPVNALAATGGDPIAVTASSGSGSITFTRLDGRVSFYVSDSPGGPELTNLEGETINSRGLVIDRTESFSGYLNGTQIRCVSGTAANVGKSVPLKHTEFDPSGGLQIAQIHIASSWPSAPQAGDKFVIEPPPVNGEAVPFDQWCKLLPWSPFEGRHGGRDAIRSVTFASVNGESFATAGGPVYRNASVRFYSTGILPNGIEPGKTYYVTDSDEDSNTFYYSETYGGSRVAQAVDETQTGSHYMVVVDGWDRINPFPPGFNYAGQQVIPSAYQVDRGASIYPFNRISSGTTVTLRMALHYGEPVLHVNLGFGSTSIGHKEIGVRTEKGFSWWDPKRQTSWAKGEPDGCFARMQAILAGVKRALDEQGDTGRVEMISWLQGEEDGLFSDLAADYAANLKRLKTDLRQAVVDAGLYSGKPEQIPFIHPKIKLSKGAWPYGETINAAIVQVADDDVYSRYVEVEDLPMMSDLDPNNDDKYHFAGSSYDTLGKRIFAAWEDLQATSGYTELQVCNLALANLGEPATITSISPPDGSREAALCAQFFAFARDQLLEKHAWDFALRSKTLTVRAESPRVDWKYAYDYPSDVVSVLAVVRSDVDYNYKTMGTTGQQPYSVELDANGKRMLLTDQQNALLLYVAKVEDSTKWSSLFVRALSWQLAAHLAGPVLKGEEGMKMVGMCEQMAERTFRQATKHDSDHKRDVDVNDHVPVWQRHRSNRGYRF